MAHPYYGESDRPRWTGEERERDWRERDRWRGSEADWRQGDRWRASEADWRERERSHGRGASDWRDRDRREVEEGGDRGWPGGVTGAEGGGGYGRGFFGAA
jgi:hypothetical protein